ncbi:MULTISPECIES: hypothetical protein [unclassified Psychrobacter]|uniref:hypothetical protein n=1 Tax=unclassified Psychrobacter TaxID=196806 RepID=UPI0025B35082|nr:MULTISPECIES: hypothetical protein [unclassified Psychrobacter]MDN3453218.1 hypothetical protein [Psychrobacter sp. APC 3350]MDN3503220.1 hypothetical protein [Psychrobacter sp. 5A.1]
MEMKHVIIFAVIGIVALLGFNMINGNNREEKRAALVSSAASEPSNVSVGIPDTHNEASSSTEVTSQPLGEQPKAIVDNATSKIDQAQQAEQDRLEQVSTAQ